MVFLYVAMWLRAVFVYMVTKGSQDRRVVCAHAFSSLCAVFARLLMGLEAVERYLHVFFLCGKALN